ncbi:MAG: hypothetical protein ACM3X6_13715 [Patescibacteria group bacterium]
MEPNELETRPDGLIQNIGLLDLTGMKSPDNLKDVTGIKNVGLILVPESLNKALMGVPMECVGCIAPVPEGANVRMQTGITKIPGKVLANPGGREDDILVVTGITVITSPVEKVGYKQLHVIGQLLAPKGSEAALTAGITRLTGMVAYHNGNPRVFTGDTCFSRDFLELLDAPATLVIMGNCTVERDVPAALLKEKLAGIILMGNLAAPKALLPMLQMLTEAYGKIVDMDEIPAEEAEA